MARMGWGFQDTKRDGRSGSMAQAVARKASRGLQAMLLATSALVAAASAAQAQTVWTGANSDSWFDAANWSAGLPTIGVDAEINSSNSDAPVVAGLGAFANNLLLGTTANGTLRVEGGGSLITDTGTLGDAAGIGGGLVVVGPNSLWTTDNIIVGNQGNGGLIIAFGGAVVSDNDVYVGYGTTSTGIVTVTGQGSTLTVTDVLNIGYQGQGTVTVEDSGTLNVQGLILGQDAGVQGTLTVSGANSTLSVSGITVEVGFNGNGAVTVSDGATVNVGAAVFARNAGSQGSLTLSGGSSWTTTNSVFIGESGAGTLLVQSGSLLEVEGLVFAVSDPGTAAGLVTGAGSQIRANGSIVVGGSGIASLTVAAGASVTSVEASIANQATSVATATVTGAGSSWATSSFFAVGGNGIGTLNVEEGGTVSAGTVMLGSGSGVGIVNVSGAGSLLSSAGDLAIGSFGTAALTVFNGGAVTVGGTVTIAGDAGAIGTLNIGAGDGSPAAAPGTFTAGALVFGVGAGALVFNHTSDSYQFSTGISGTGSIQVQSGTTVLTGNSSGFTGSTSVDGGTLMVSGSLGGNTLDIGNFGAGTLTVFDGGSVAVAGAATLAAGVGSSGTLNIGAASGAAAAAPGTFSAGSLAFGSGTGTLVFNHTSSGYQFATALSGTGTVAVLAGTTNLTGDSSGFSGATTVSGGTLAVNGVLGGTLGLSGGRLQGTGAIGPLTVGTGATVAPGNSIGTLTVNGNAAFNAGSLYEVELDSAGNSDLLHATGQITLNGGTVSYVGSSASPLVTYTIMTADGGLDGAFASVTPAPTSAFLTPVLSYDANNVYLQVARNAASFCSVGVTANQCATGAGAESLGFGNTLYGAILPLSAGAAQGAFNLLSGEIYASTRSVLIEDSRFVRNAANDRLRGTFGGVAAPATQVLAYGPGGPQKAPAATQSFAAWGTAFGSWGSFDGNGNAAGLSSSTGGFLVGADGLVAETWRLGLLTGFSQTSFNVDDRASSGSSDNYHLGLYGGTQWGALAFRSGLAYTWHDIGTDRSVAFTGFSDALSGSYRAGTFQAFGELGYRVPAGAAAFEPFANLAYVNLNTNGFTEQGGAAALTGQSGTTDVTFTTLGLRASADFALAGLSASARGLLGWRHAFGDTTPLATQYFTGGVPFTVAGVPIAVDAAVIEAGLDLNLTRAATFAVFYSGELASDAQAHGFNAAVAVKF